MSRLYLPVAVTVLLLLPLTYWESVLSDRFTSSSVDAATFGKRFANLPMEIGSWVGVDNPVDEKTLDVAGAVNHVSRTYTNQATGQNVDVWLCVGHSRDICRHTPDICYPSQGFAKDGTQTKQSIDIPGEKDRAMFHTARFRKETSLGTGGPMVRVFWAWNPNREDEKQWVAPDDSRLSFGNNTALYKLYFTAGMKERDEPVGDNVAVEFAKVMLPVINKVLFPADNGQSPFEAPSADADASKENSDSTSVPAEATDARPAPPAV